MNKQTDIDGQTVGALLSGGVVAQYRILSPLNLAVLLREEHVHIVDFVLK